MGNAHVTITGNLTVDPQTKQFDSGKRKTKFSIASTPSFKDQTGEYRDGTTTFYDVECWGRLGDHVAQSLNKGEPVVVSGRLSSETWDAQDGTQRRSIVITATVVGHDLSWGASHFERPQREVQEVTEAA